MEFLVVEFLKTMGIFICQMFATLVHSIEMSFRIKSIM
jgi:hypothetical protein